MKHVTWNDIVKLGTMNPIVQKNLDELGEMPGITHAYALMAMVDELDGQLERFKQDARRYQYLREPLSRPRDLDVVNNDLAVVDGTDLDQAIDVEVAKTGSLEPTDAVADLFTQGEAGQLADFVEVVLGDWPEVGGMDGFDLQDLGETTGLLKGEERSEPCGDECSCAGYSPDFPVTCYRYTPLMSKVRRVAGVVQLRRREAQMAVAKNSQVGGEKVASDQAEG